MKLITFGLIACLLTSPIYAADKVTYNDALNSWKTGAGANKPIPDADTVNNWKDNVKPPKSSSGKITRKIIFDSPKGLGAGNFTLYEPYSNFDFIEITAASDDNAGSTVYRIAPHQIDYILSKSIHHSALSLFGISGHAWQGRFKEDKRTFITSAENSKIFRIEGLTFAN